MKASWLLAIPLLLPVALLAQEPPPAPEASTTAPTPQDLQNRMQHMTEQMAQIHGTQDPAERQRLMQEHMQSMNAGMMMMGQTMRGMGPGQAQGQQCRPDDAACRLDKMQAQQDMMRGRMGMMQMMMQQMTEHMMQQQSGQPGSAPAQPPAGQRPQD